MTHRGQEPSQWRRVEQPSRFSSAFTLIELLVVIAIIAILVAILLPAITGAWRRSIVLACPIAFVDAAGNVWICDPRGERQLKVSTSPNMSANPRWSPQGDRIAYESESTIVVVNPGTRRAQVVEHVEGPEWVDGQTLVGTRYRGGHNELWRVDLRTGTAAPWKALRALGEPFGHISLQYQPIHTAGYVVAEGETLWNPKMDVVIRSKEWGLKRTIWADPGNDIVDGFARIDQMGEWIAWSRGRAPGLTDARVVAIKRLDDHSSKPPEILGLEYSSVIFCDWTSDGHLLVTIDKPQGRVMAIMHREGRVIRELPLGMELHPGTGPIATWRRYERW